MTPFRLVLPFGKRLRAHHFGRAGLIAAGIAAAVVFFILGAALRLLVGPVSLGPFAGTLQTAIDQALPGITVKYDQAAIEWSREEGRVSLVVLGARVFDADGRIIAQAPKADIDLAAGAFLRGKVEVRHITLVGVQLTLVRTRTGGLRLGVERDTGEQSFLDDLTDTLSATNSASSTLQRFAIRDARMAFYDEVTGLFIVAPRANMKIETAGVNLDASLDADIEISGRPARVTMGLTLPPNKGPVRGALSVTGLDVSALGVNTKTFDALKPIAMQSDFSASFTIAHGSHLSMADFGVDARGKVRIPGLIESPVPIRSMHLLGRYDGATNRVLIEDGTLDSSNATAHVAGTINFVYDQFNELSQVAWDTAADKIRLDDAALFPFPLSIDRIGFRGSFLIATEDLVIDRLGISSGALSAEASGKVTLVDGRTPAIVVAGKVSPIAVRDLLRFWPLTIGAGAREWIDANIFAGSVGPIVIDTHLPAGALDQPALPDGALSLTFPMSGVEASYVRGLRHLTAATGSAKLTGDTFTADVTSAKIGPLTVSKGHAVVANLHVPGSPGNITAHVDGSMPDLLALIDMKPLNYPTRFGIDIAGTKGTAAIDLGFRVPMLRNLSVDAVGISVKAQVNGFDIALGPHTRLSDGTVAFAIDNNKLEANGNVSLAGSRLAVDWTEDFKATGKITTRVEAKGSLDEPAREALALRTGEYLQGPMNIDALLTGRRGQLTQADMTADLTPTTLAADLVGINKPAGTPATAHVLATFAPGAVIRSTDARITGPGTSITANATFANGGVLQTLDIPGVKFGTANDFSLNFVRSASGVDLSIKGHSLDGSRLARRGSGSSVGPHGGMMDEESFDEPFHVAVKLDRLVLRDGVAVAPFDLDVSGVGNRPGAMTLSGSLSRTSTVSGSIVQGDAGRKLTLATNDTGLLARGLFGLTSMHGGRFEFAATLPGRASDTTPRDAATPDYQGTMTVRDFTLTNQPFLARLFTAASIVGLADLLSGQGLSISHAEVPFSSKNGVIAIHDAYATGPTVGATADGYIDRPVNAMAVKGSLVPVLGLDFNRVLNVIPVVGDLLTSKKGEGVFGVTYSIKGNADEPSVSVNPLSMLTPGILRRIFQGRMPTAAQAPSNNPPAIAPALQTAPSATAPSPTSPPPANASLPKTN